jgi:flagellar basal-body rod modification protein FlgD
MKVDATGLRLAVFSDTYAPQVNGVARTLERLVRAVEDRGGVARVFTVEDPEAVTPAAASTAAAIELASPADSVKVQVTTPDGTVVNTIDLNAQTAGRHSFNWNVPSSLQGSNLSFKVLATAGGKDVSSVALQNASIKAVSTVNNSLALELSSGDRVPYDSVWAFL